MTTLKQIEANRLNAKKSTGPRTAQGKSVARLNALKHGLFATDPIIQGEDPAHLEALRTGHYDRFQPATTDEHVLVAALVRDAWRLERCANSETAVRVHAFERYKERDHQLSRCETSNAEDLMHLPRRIDAAERNYRRNLELLIKLQAARQKALVSPAILLPVPCAVPSPSPKPEATPQPQSAQPLKPRKWLC